LVQRMSDEEIKKKMTESFSLDKETTNRLFNH